jgi:hypothetical protein
MDKPLLSTKDIMNIITKNESKKLWKSSYIPFAGDTDNLLIIDTSNSNNIYEWNSDEGIDIDDCIADSLGHFFETYRNSLLNGNCEYIDDVGVVEKLANKPSNNRK